MKIRAKIIHTTIPLFQYTVYTLPGIIHNEVSKEMEYLLREKSKSSLKTRNAYALLNASGTRTLSLDGYLKSELSQPTKAADKELASSVGVRRY